jgi:hypothetical protein
MEDNNPDTRVCLVPMLLAIVVWWVDSIVEGNYYYWGTYPQTPARLLYNSGALVE